MTAVAGYAYAKAYSGLECRSIGPVSPAKKEPIKQPRARAPLPIRCPGTTFVKCPAGQDPATGRPRLKHGRFIYCQDQGLCGPSAQRRLSEKGACQQDGRHRRRLSGAPPRAAPTHTLERETTGGSTNAIAGGRRAFMARPRPGTGWAELSGAASTT